MRGRKTARSVFLNYFKSKDFDDEESSKMVNTLESFVNGSRIRIDVKKGKLLREIDQAWKKITSAKKLSELKIEDAESILRILNEN